MKIKVKKLKGKTAGETSFSKKGKPVAVHVDIKKHKGDVKELASTIKHELLHVKHPKMTEKQVYTKSLKTKILPAEQKALLALLKVKKDFKTGDLITRVNEQKRSINKTNETPSKTRLSIMGLV